MEDEADDKSALDGIGPEDLVPVSLVRSLLGRIDSDTAARLLIGCALDDGESDELSVIEGCQATTATATLTLAGGRRVNLLRFPRGAIVDRRSGYPLRAAIEHTKTPADHRDSEVRGELRQMGIDPEQLRSAADRLQVLSFLVLVEKGELPTEAALYAFHEAIKPAARPQNHQRAVAVLESMLSDCARNGKTPSGLPWRLAWFLNQLSRFDDVVALSETPQAQAPQGMDRAYLNTIRASALLTLAEIRQDVGLLNKAEAALKIAYAIDGGAEVVRALYRKLNRLRALPDLGSRAPPSR